MTCPEYWIAQPNPSPPFTRLIALDLYDGPTAGVAECAHCGAAYRFVMLDWDDWQDVRIFSLAPLPPGAFAALVEACRPLFPPHWPIWCPLWSFPTDRQRKEAERQVGEIEQSAGAPLCAVAWKRELEGMLALQILEVDELPEVNAVIARGGAAGSSEGASRTQRDWFARLGLTRKLGADSLCDEK